MRFLPSEKWFDAPYRAERQRIRRRKANAAGRSAETRLALRHQRRLRDAFNKLNRVVTSGSLASLSYWGDSRFRILTSTGYTMLLYEVPGKNAVKGLVFATPSDDFSALAQAAARDVLAS